MENQNLLEINERIKNGDVEAAMAFVNNPEMFTLPTEEPEPAYTEVEERDEEPISEAPDELLEDEETSEFINPLEEARKAADEVEKRHLERERTLKAEIESQKEEARKREEALLKQVEDARIAAERKVDEDDEDFDYFGSEDSSTPAVKTATPVEKESPKNTDEVTKELLTLKQEIEAQKMRDETARTYSRFWESEEGKHLRPSGMDAHEAIRQLDDVFDALVGQYGTEKGALRALHDLRNPDTAHIYKDQLESKGIKLPSEYDKMYDTWAVALFKDGKKIDPINGAVVNTGNKLSNLEDAYFLMNRQNMLYKAKMEAFQQVQKKKSQHEQAARTPNPSRLSSFTEQSRVMDNNYQTSVLKAAAKAGYKFGGPTSVIRDPELRAQVEELFNP